LLAEGFQARQEQFGGQRLLLFAHPRQLFPQTTNLPAIFAAQIRLNEVAYPVSVQAGTVLPIELQWQSLTPLREDYHVFIHLLNQTGEVVAQADGQPVHWSRPTSTWAINETITDRHGLWLPAETPATTYQLWVGLYHPADGQRLLLANGADYVSFAVTIEGGSLDR
jgi:hypothetical protein